MLASKSRPPSARTSIGCHVGKMMQKLVDCTDCFKMLENEKPADVMPTDFSKLLHKTFYCFIKLIERRSILCLHCIDNAMLYMIFQNYFRRIADRRTHSGKLNKHFRAVFI